MKVLGVVCSPRLHGNTEVMVEKALAKAQEEGAEVELVTLAGKTVMPCDACYSCRNTGKCHIKDDMQDIYPKLLEADGIIFGTPVYFGTVTAQAKAVIDRTFVFSPERRLRNKVIGVVVAAGRVGATSAFTVFSVFSNFQRMIMAGLAAGFGSAEKGDIVNDRRGMANAEALGSAVVERIQSSEVPN